MALALFRAGMQACGAGKAEAVEPLPFWSVYPLVLDTFEVRSNAGGVPRGAARIVGDRFGTAVRIGVHV